MRCILKYNLLTKQEPAVAPQVHQITGTGPIPITAHANTDQPTDSHNDLKKAA